MYLHHLFRMQETGKASRRFRPARRTRISSSSVSSAPNLRSTSDQRPAADAYPQSPAEQYITARLRSMEEISAGQANNNLLNSSAIPLSPSTTPRFNPFQSFGFGVSPNIIVSPPSDGTARSGIHRTSHSSQPDNRRSLFQPIAPSNQSTADYPAAAGSSVATSSILRTQMSHEQRMQTWRQQKTAKMHKKRRYHFIYDSPSQTAPNDKIFTTMLVTPNAPSAVSVQRGVPPTPAGDATTRRMPTMSPFAYPGVASSALNTVSSIPNERPLASVDEKSSLDHEEERCPTPPKRMDCSENDSSVASIRSRRADIKSSESD